ncbi:hypothetical protein [Salinarimonas rosea]|uniref:hypothetical protein n=1 Tax=Salinarimonas rosea TaxID=552063 RepID=UPI0003F9C1CB|nr:hypothetical protein [Salinarimonas rosea]
MADIIAFPVDRARARPDEAPGAAEGAEIRELVVMPRLNLARLCRIFDLDIEGFRPGGRLGEESVGEAAAERREGNGTPAA